MPVDPAMNDYHHAGLEHELARRLEKARQAWCEAARDIFQEAHSHGLNCWTVIEAHKTRYRRNAASGEISLPDAAIPCPDTLPVDELHRRSL